jgi:hypothetical protein
MHVHSNITIRHPSQHSLPDHPLVVLGLVVASASATRILILLLTRLANLRGTACLCLSRIRTSGRALPSGVRLRDYHAISITRSRDERYKTKLPGAPTVAFRVLGELDRKLLRTLA